MQIQGSAFWGIGVVLTLSAPAHAGTAEAHQHCWAENVGWTNWRDANGSLDGVSIGSSFLSGWIWAENVGWINVGDGSGPYENLDGSNFGVNIAQDTGDLSGFAWGENIGWVNFDTSSLGPERASLDVCGQRLRGYAWAENIGWLNLDHPMHFVGVATVDCDANGEHDPCEIVTGQSPDCNSDGVPDACGTTFACDPPSDAQCPSCDLYCDGVVNGIDIAIIANGTNWGYATCDAGDPRADVDNNGQVNGLDVAVCVNSTCFGL